MRSTTPNTALIIMSKYYEIEIAGTGSGGAVDIFLTSTGAAGGRPCKNTIPNPGLAGLLTPNSGNTTVASDGTPFTEKPLTAGKGRPFEIETAFCNTDVYDDLKDLIDYCVEHSTLIQVTGTGEPGDFDVACSPNFGEGYPIDFEGFGEDVIKGLKMRFIVAT